MTLTMRTEATYTCARCNGVFKYDPEWSEEDSLTEAEDIFGKPVSEWKEGTATTICDDCFQAIHPLKSENTYALLKARAEI